MLGYYQDNTLFAMSLFFPLSFALFVEIYITGRLSDVKNFECFIQVVMGSGLIWYGGMVALSV